MTREVRAGGGAPPRIAVAVPFPSELVARLARRADVEVAYTPELLPASRFPGDYAGEPGFARTAAGQARFDALVDGADILFGVPDTSPSALARTLRANPGPRWVHTMAAGGGAQVRASGLSLRELRGVRVTTSAGVHGRALAEFAVMGLLAGLKDLPGRRADQRERLWPERAPVRQLRDASVLILGTGGVGTAVAETLRAFGSRTIGIARHQRERAGWDRIASPAELRAILPEVDAVVCALPETSETIRVFDAEAIGCLRPGAVFVNVGRGSTVDEHALAAALTDGRVGFAALDVFEREPLPADSPLWGMDRVLISPHTAALDAHEEEHILALFEDNLDRFLAGAPLRNEMDRELFY